MLNNTQKNNKQAITHNNDIEMFKRKADEFLDAANELLKGGNSILQLSIICDFEKKPPKREKIGKLIYIQNKEVLAKIKDDIVLLDFYKIWKILIEKKLVQKGTEHMYLKGFDSLGIPVETHFPNKKYVIMSYCID